MISRATFQRLAERLYDVARELGAIDDDEQKEALYAELYETVEAISMGIDAGSSFVDSAMRDLSTAIPEQGQELVPAEPPSVD